MVHEKLLRHAGVMFARLSPGAKAALAAALALAALAIAWLVYAAGGVRFAWLHLMYVPVVLSGLAFGVPGGLLAGVAGGLLLGPLMPLDTATGEMQSTVNWMYRLGFFALIGALVGTWAQLSRRYLGELEWLNEHYHGTDLLNLAGLLRQLDATIRRTPEGSTLAVAVIQLNTFLEIQNTFGAAFGMRVLDQVAARTRRVVPPGALVALVQPDRLATVVAGGEAGSVTRERIRSAVEESYQVDGLPLHVEASVGMAFFPAHGRSAEELLQKASIAMHWAGSSRAILSVYDSANDRTSRDNLLLLGALPEAIAHDELKVWHQARLALASGRVVGTEALLRWQHPQRGMVPPDLFIPRAEETTLINPLTHTVIAQACAQAEAWRDAGHPLKVAINLSVHNLRDHLLLEVLEQSARRHKLQPQDIELEITESAVMADPDYCIRIVSQLRAHGYHMVIDNFGVGQASLAYLQRLAVSAIKIDRAFVTTLAQDPGNQKIVRSMLQLAEALGLSTIADGVEDEDSLALLREWGCHYAQGYHLHRPAPPEDVLKFLEEKEGSGEVASIPTITPPVQ